MKHEQIGTVRAMKSVLQTVWAVTAALAVMGGVSVRADEAHASAGEADARALHVVGTNSVVIGTIYNCNITNVPFRVVNKGTKPVVIERLKPTCSCATGTFSTNQILPGGEATITVRLDPNTIAGEFDRSVWVIADDADTPYLRLALTGTAEPLFSGVPEKSISLTAKDVGMPLTNRITLVSAAADVFLAPLTIETNGAVRMDVTVATNLAKTASYEITTVLTPLELGRQTASITLPIIGRATADPLVISFKVATGSELAAIPDRFVFTLDSQPQTFRVILRGKDARLDPAAFTSDPAVEGVSVSVVKGRRASELMVKIEVSPKGAEALYLNTNSVLQLRHPGFSPATVTFADEGDEPKKSGSRRDRLPDIFQGFSPRGKGKFSF